MDNSFELHAEMKDLEAKFRGIEEESGRLVEVPAGSLLVIRMDGVKLSGTFLKDSLTNGKFDSALDGAVRTLIHLFANSTYEVNRPFMRMALAVSDEVSIVIPGLPNIYKGRLMKLCTILAGTLSSAMTGNLGARTEPTAKSPKGWPRVVAFDARPLILKDWTEVEQYVQNRRLFATRNLVAKVLRLKSSLPEDEIFGDGRRDNLHELVQLARSTGLLPMYQSAGGGARMFIPGAERQLDEVRVPFPPGKGQDWRARVRALPPITIAPVGGAPDDGD